MSWGAGVIFSLVRHGLNLTLNRMVSYFPNTLQLHKVMFTTYAYPVVVCVSRYRAISANAFFVFTFVFHHRGPLSVIKPKRAYWWLAVLDQVTRFAVVVEIGCWFSLGFDLPPTALFVDWLSFQFRQLAVHQLVGSQE